jgi:nicotinate-nucleotide adenylyltransferase
MAVTPLPPWGILGGTFDPPHCGHLAIAAQTCETLSLAGILFIPAGIPPHKRDRMVTSAEHRVAMVALAIAGDPAFRLDRIEVDRPGPSFAVDTMTELRARHRLEGREDPWLIVSAEALAGLESWREPRRLLELCRVAVVPRRGYPTPDHAWLGARFPGAADRFRLLDGPDLGHSASDIRARVRAGRTIRYLVPPAVERYIDDHDLYRSGVPDASTG